jgi:hypothetical protein
VDLWDLTRLLLRRWYFAVPMLLASIGLVVLVAQSVAPDYKAMGYMQMIPAPSAGKVPDPDAKPRPANPWLDLGYAALGNAAALSVTDERSLERLAADGYSDSVTVVLNERTPLFEIEAVGNSPKQATATVRQVIKLLQADIAAKQRQYNALPEDTISTLVINDGDAPTQESSKVKRVLIVAAGVGLLITTALTIALDYWLRSRARRRQERDASRTFADAPEQPADADEERTRRVGRSVAADASTTAVSPTVPITGRTNGLAGGGKVHTSKTARAASTNDVGADATIVLPRSQPGWRSRKPGP